MMLSIEDWYKDEHIPTIINHLIMSASCISTKSAIDIKLVLVIMNLLKFFNKSKSLNYQLT